MSLNALAIEIEAVFALGEMLDTINEFVIIGEFANKIAAPLCAVMKRNNNVFSARRKSVNPQRADKRRENSARH